eukprot:TRINITY_DN1080_c0_g3_i2.p2 TRINITY_DN1080_c0_g3~~TRINITY_DN1080_c0_g3_i2.p2  ORF type:complete len:384 (+),score=57.32 TRINITY_DN1080_c0_g3_i2:1144-2295(+)
MKYINFSQFQNTRNGPLEKTFLHIISHIIKDWEQILQKKPLSILRISLNTKLHLNTKTKRTQNQFKWLLKTNILTRKKDWMCSYSKDMHVDYSTGVVRYKDFVNKELILFSIENNIRVLPSIYDGLTPGQRKVLFSCFKRKLNYKMTVAQLAGYVSEQAKYLYGEFSLMQTIIQLAQNFVGSNNINLLQPIGQFGTRNMGGKDSASPRYLNTALSKITRYIFREEDDDLLDYLIEEGQRVEPEWYIPIIPMVLINGAEGIGAGWMSNIPNFNPREICEILKKKIKGDCIFPNIMPWYKNYSGVIAESEESGEYVSYGKYEICDDNTLEITELPIKKWTRDYKTFLEGKIEVDDLSQAGENNTATYFNKALISTTSSEMFKLVV